MTAALAPARPAPGRAPSVLRLSAGRLLRLELRRNPMIWMVPLAVAMFWFDTYRSSMLMPPLWGQRSMYLEEGRPLLDFAPFVAGAAAWAASRDGRRGTGDQVAVTALPRWAARLTAWAATTAWALAAYAGCLGALLAVTAHQGAPGDPLWWPVAVSAAGVVAASALGFTAGALFPSRYTVPLVGILALLALVMSQYKFTHSTTYGLLSPTNEQNGVGLEAGVFYRYLPDLSITQILFLAGLAVAALGALGVFSAYGTRALRASAVVVTAVGLAASGTAFGLAGTARTDADGVVVPVLHDPADDRPIAFTPLCAGTPVPVCLSPVYRAYLPVIAADLDPVLAEVAGLPGAPVRVAQVPDIGGPASDTMAAVGGSPAVATLNLDWEGWYSSAQLASWVRGQTATAIVDHLVGTTDPAQQAVAAALLQDGGVPMEQLRPGAAAPADPGQAAGPASGTPAYAAAQRFAALPAATRHAWLTTHLTALRTGDLTPEQLP